MNQVKVGQFITKKRKEKNLTQEGLAELLGVSNKTVSKWECGKCMPDYSLIQPLCSALGISIAELLDGNECEPTAPNVDNEQILKLIKDMEQIKKDRDIPRLYLSGIILAIIGIALCLLSKLFGGSKFQDALSGYFIGLAIGLFLVSEFIIIFATACIIKKNKCHKP